MKPISEMSDQEKSVRLAKLCGWIRPAGDGFKQGLWSIKVPGHQLWGFTNYWKSEPTVLADFDLYDDLTVAWRVVRFVHQEYINGEDWMDGFFTWWNDSELFRFDNPQGFFLDKILSLAIESGMCEDTAVSQEVQQ